jgi:WD40 repeat protein
MHNGAVKCLVYMKDEKTLISGGDDCFINVINFYTGEHVYKLSGHSGSISCLLFLNSLCIFASAGWDG